jgi:hypothetical protein
MNALTIQGLNGLGRHMRGLSAPLTIEIDHGDMRTRFRHELAGLGEPQTDDPMDQDFGINLTPGFAPWWKQVPPPKGMPQSAATGARAKPSRGELFRAKDAYRESFPYTPSMDARDLPSSDTQEPLKQLPHRDYPGSFPHRWIDYRDLYPATGPEQGPTPSGWEPAPMLSHEEMRAVNAAMPGPWASPEDMAQDISGIKGFGSLHEAFTAGRRVRGMGQLVPSSVTTAIAGQAMQAGATAAAQGATPSTTAQIISSVVDFGSSAASLYLQQRQIEQQREAERKARALEAQRLALLQQQAAAAGVPFRPPPSEGGIGTGTIVGAAAGVAVLGTLVYILTRKGGRR